MKNINLIPDGLNGYISAKVYYKESYCFCLCVASDGFPYLCAALDDGAAVSLNTNEVFEFNSHLYQIDANNNVRRIVDEAKHRRAAAIKAADSCRVCYVGTPSPSGHDVNYIKVTKTEMLKFLRATALEEWDKEQANHGRAHV